MHDGNIHDLKKRILELEKQIKEARKRKDDLIDRNGKINIRKRKMIFWIFWKEKSLVS